MGLPFRRKIKWEGSISTYTRDSKSLLYQGLTAGTQSGGKVVKIELLPPTTI